MIKSNESRERKTVVVIGNGMVGHRFCEKLVEFDTDNEFEIVTFCEEPRAAYDRVGLTKYFDHRDADELMIADSSWYAENNIRLYVGERAERIDRDNKVVVSDSGREIEYDRVVLATGSYPFVPPIPGVEKDGVFVYRTIEDLESIIEYAEHCETAAVIGGGLLGLEAAKAAHDLGLKTHIVEFAPRLMPRQVDDGGSRQLVDKIESLGLEVHLNHATKEVLGPGKVEGMQFADDSELECQMLIVSAGIRPRDEIAGSCGLDLGERGGVVVNDHLQTSDPDIFAIGEVALHGNMIYGLVAPGYDMADVTARYLCGEQAVFLAGDLSTKLKLLGVDVASFGQYEFEDGQATSLVKEDPFGGVYKKLFFSNDGQHLLGGILVGDASDYGLLSALQKQSAPLEMSPQDLIYGVAGDAESDGANALPDSAQICSCNNVSKGEILDAVRSGGCCSPADVKACTKAGAGCGGCMPMVTDIVNAELAESGIEINKSLCEHFEFSRTEMFEIIKIKGIKTFAELIETHGSGNGCEICKPAAVSIFASLWNENILDHATLQDTNDRFLANMQRGGLYSVIPRVPGGEITPEKLIVLGEVAQKYGLYTKITGGQRIDLFGAEVHQLPDIWEELVEAGFESGHAYGKALRTVKSCVGSTWCRYGVQDSVGFAIRVEERYRGIRAPHKLKSAVSGCVRECAEAQGKDFGLIATETGYNLYVGGNGGANPRHADLLATDLDEETAIKYIDRFLMYYIQTADKLTRTSTWLDKLDGGVEYLKQVVIDDKLGICDELEKQMQYLVDTYKCEWNEVVKDPERRKWFSQFVNSDETETGIEIISERGQNRPADWKKDNEILPIVDEITWDGKTVSQLEDELDVENSDHDWVTVGKTWDFPEDGGSTVKYGDVQIAVFNFSSRGEWYASQNMCPHKRAFVLSRGIIGDSGDVPKIACPLHKKTFDLGSGESTQGEDYSIKVFDVQVVGDDVQLFLPASEKLDPILATGSFCGTACKSHD